MSRIAIIAAMERELGPLVRGWKRSKLAFSGREFAFFENGEVVAIISGIGCRNAELAALGAVEKFNPTVLISAGLAGALIRSLKAGSVFTPGVVVDAAGGSEYRCSPENNRVSGGVLVSAGKITGVEQKQELVNQFHALVVDMEAVGVARVAQQQGIAFRCVKAISDEADFVMPPMAKFIDGNGKFQASKFVFWAALRPWQWMRVATLASNSKRAIRELCEWLEKDTTAGLQAAEVVTLNRAELSEVKR
jgi:nucleoside phosphorylase